ncbi:hypothetical protein [Spiroplasma endosymbiont of Asaphidion curtum]
MKTQVIIEKESKIIIATNFSLGKKHDFCLPNCKVKCN